MAHALSNTSSASGVSAKFQQLVAAWQTARAKRAVFNRTCAELQALGDRDLADIGIARAQIRTVAADVAKTSV